MFGSYCPRYRLRVPPYETTAPGTGPTGPFIRICNTRYGQVYTISRLYTLIYQTYSVIISLYRLRAGRPSAVGGGGASRKTPVKINGISKYIIGYDFTQNRTMTSPNGPRPKPQSGFGRGLKYTGNQMRIIGYPIIYFDDTHQFSSILFGSRRTLRVFCPVLRRLVSSGA